MGFVELLCGFHQSSLFGQSILCSFQGFKQHLHASTSSFLTLRLPFTLTNVKLHLSFMFSGRKISTHANNCWVLAVMIITQSVSNRPTMLLEMQYVGFPLNCSDPAAESARPGDHP